MHAAALLVCNIQHCGTNNVDLPSSDWLWPDESRGAAAARQAGAPQQACNTPLASRAPPAPRWQGGAPVTGSICGSHTTAPPGPQGRSAGGSAQANSHLISRRALDKSVCRAKGCCAEQIISSGRSWPGRPARHGPPPGPSTGRIVAPWDRTSARPAAGPRPLAIVCLASNVCQMPRHPQPRSLRLPAHALHCAWCRLQASPRHKPKLRPGLLRPLISLCNPAVVRVNRGKPFRPTHTPSWRHPAQPPGGGRAWANKCALPGAPV
jgi:hypothetical protein